MVCSPVEEIGCVQLLSQSPGGLLMVGVHVVGYRRTRGGERKGLGSREAGFDAGKVRGSMGKCRSGVLMAARTTWEMRRPPGDIDGRLMAPPSQNRQLEVLPGFMRGCYCLCRYFSKIKLG